MAEILKTKILAQVATVANTLIDMYTVPTGQTANMTVLSICNQDSSMHAVRFSIAKNGEADAQKQYQYYGLQCPNNDTFVLDMEGMGIEAGDVVRIWADSSLLSAQLFGAEFGYRGEDIR